MTHNKRKMKTFHLSWYSFKRYHSREEYKYITNWLIFLTAPSSTGVIMFYLKYTYLAYIIIWCIVLYIIYYYIMTNSSLHNPGASPEFFWRGCFLELYFSRGCFFIKFVQKCMVLKSIFQKSSKSAWFWKNLTSKGVLSHPMHPHPPGDALVINSSIHIYTRWNISQIILTLILTFS